MKASKPYVLGNIVISMGNLMSVFLCRFEHASMHIPYASRIFMLLAKELL